MCSLADGVEASPMDVNEDVPMASQTLDDSQAAEAESLDVPLHASPEASETPMFKQQEPDEIEIDQSQSQECPETEQASKKLKVDPAAMSLVLEADDGMFAPTETEIGSFSDGMPPPPAPKGKGKGKKGKSGKNTSGADAPSQAVVAASPSDPGPGDDQSVASGQSKTKAQGLGSKKATKTNPRYCRGDGLYYSHSDMAPKSAFCFKCKYSMDVLTKLAKAENRPEWITEIKGNEKVLQNVIRKYKEQTGDGCFARKRNMRGNLMTTLSETAAKSRVLYDTELEMMTEDAYQQFAMTEAGGRLSKAAAIAQWAEWRCQVESGDVPEDLIFDRKRGLRIGVATRDTVHFQSESWLHEVFVGP